MKRRVQGSLVDWKNIPRDLLDAFGDRPAMHGPRLERPEDEHVERAGQQVRDRLACHSVDSRHYQQLVSTVNTNTRVPSARPNPDTTYELARAWGAARDGAPARGSSTIRATTSPDP